MTADRADLIAASTRRLAECVVAGEKVLEAEVRLAAALRPLDPDARNPLPVLRCQTPKCGWGTLEWHEHSGSPCPNCGGLSFALEREGSVPLGFTQTSSATDPLVAELLDAARPDVVPCAACSAAREEDGPISHPGPECDARPEPAAVEWRGEFCGEGAFRVEMAAAPASSEEGESGSGGREVVQPEPGGFESSAPPAEANRTSKATPSYTSERWCVRRNPRPAPDAVADAPGWTPWEVYLPESGCVAAGVIAGCWWEGAAYRIAAALNGEAEPPTAAHVVTKARTGGGRDEPPHYYAVLPRRETEAEALADLARWEGQQEAEPVAWRWHGKNSPPSAWLMGSSVPAYAESGEYVIEPLFVAPPPVPAAPDERLREAAKRALPWLSLHTACFVVGNCVLAGAEEIAMDLRAALDAPPGEPLPWPCTCGRDEKCSRCAAPPAETVGAEDLLRRCEFVVDSRDGEKYCPLCESREDAGHEESCVLGQFIAARPRAGTGEAP